MKLNIDDYVRQKRGHIYRIKNKGELEAQQYRNEANDKENEGFIAIKSSPNIIDLIEVGDILKFKDMKHYQQVYAIDKEKLYLTEYIYMSGLQKYKKEIEEDLEWIITHEQIEQIHYKIGGKE